MSDRFRSNPDGYPYNTKTSSAQPNQQQSLSNSIESTVPNAHKSRLTRVQPIHQPFRNLTPGPLLSTPGTGGSYRNNYSHGSRGSRHDSPQLPTHHLQRNGGSSSRHRGNHHLYSSVDDIPPDYLDDYEDDLGYGNDSDDYHREYSESRQTAGETITGRVRRKILAARDPMQQQQQHPYHTSQIQNPPSHHHHSQHQHQHHQHQHHIDSDADSNSSYLADDDELNPYDGLSPPIVQIKSSKHRHQKQRGGAYRPGGVAIPSHAAHQEQLQHRGSTAIASDENPGNVRHHHIQHTKRSIKRSTGDLPRNSSSSSVNSSHQHPHPHPHPQSNYNHADYLSQYHQSQHGQQTTSSDGDFNTPSSLYDGYSEGSFTQPMSGTHRGDPVGVGMGPQSTNARAIASFNQHEDPIPHHPSHNSNNNHKRSNSSIGANYSNSSSSNSNLENTSRGGYRHSTAVLRQGSESTLSYDDHHADNHVGHILKLDENSRSSSSITSTIAAGPPQPDGPGKANSDVNQHQQQQQRQQPERQSNAPNHSHPSTASGVLPHVTYSPETWDELTDVRTVPRDVAEDYNQELGRGSAYRASGAGADGLSFDIPREVERWNVTLPTRLEFKNITLRVMKKVPKRKAKAERSRNSHRRAAVASSEHQIGHDTCPPDGGSPTQYHNCGDGYDQYSDDYDDQDDGDSRNHDYDDDDDDDGDDDDGMSTSYNRSTPSQSRSHSGANLHKTKPKRTQPREIHLETSSGLSPGAETPHYLSELYDDEEDDDDYDDDDGHGKGALCCNKDEWEEVPQTILDNLSGVIEPGSMVAIMGSSGAGKTTLLNALSGRVRMQPPHHAGNGQYGDELDDSTPSCTGSILLNGTRVTEEELASMTGYVMQNDVFLGTLTPRETLMFQAQLALPDTISEERKLKRVNRILKQLDLMNIADVPIGSTFRKGISGGQKRRVSVAVEMIRNPSVIFLDEPTSGLDSTTAVNVMRVLKHLAQTGRTVIFTIHSPNSKILELFDTLILLSRGKIAYFGAAQKALTYFASLGYDCPSYSNPGEFYLNVLQMYSVPMYKQLLHNPHHGIETMMTPFDPRWKSLMILQGALKITRPKEIEFYGKLALQPPSQDEGGGADGDDHGDDHRLTNLDLFYQDDDEDDWVVFINGVKKETLTQRRKRHLQRLPIPKPSYAYNVTLDEADQILAEREDKRLTLITNKYLTQPVRPDKRLNPFLTNYMPKLRAMGDKNGEYDMASIGFDGGIPTGGANSRKSRQVDIVKPGKPPLGYFQQLKVLTHRTTLHVIREPLNTVARIAVNIFLSLFVGLLFFQTGFTQQSVYARVGFLFFLTSIQAFITVMGAVLTFERNVFLREYQKRIYHTSAYFLAHTLIDFVMQTVLAVLMGILAYPMVGLHPSFDRFLRYSVCLVMTAHGTHSFAIVLASLVPHRTVAVMLSPIVMVPFMMVSSFFKNGVAMPRWFGWLQYLSPQKHMFEALMDNEFRGLELTCAPFEMITVPLDSGEMQQFCPITHGREVLNLFRLNDHAFWPNFGYIIIITVVVKVLAFIALKFSAWHHQRTSVGA